MGRVVITNNVRASGYLFDNIREKTKEYGVSTQNHLSTYKCTKIKRTTLFWQFYRKATVRPPINALIFIKFRDQLCTIYT